MDNNFTLVTAVSKDYLNKLKWSISTWVLKPQFKDKELVVFYDGITEKDLDFVKLYFKKHRLIKWEFKAESKREKMLSAFVYGVKYITTDYYVKLDSDVIFTNTDDVFTDADLTFDIVSHKWGYTKPGYWIPVLDNFYNKTSTIVDPAKTDRFSHPRIISFICLHKTDFVRKVISLIGKRLPVPSHDTVLWYYGNKIGKVCRKNLKKTGVVQKNTFKGIREAICSSSIKNPLLASEIFNNIQIEITTKCNLGCYNCDRNCSVAPSTDEVTVDQVAKFVNESLKVKHEWKRIDIIGGEPTLHKNLLAIVDVIGIYKSVYKKCKVRLSTNGYSENCDSILATLPKWVNIRNSAKHSKENTFDAYNAAPVDNSETVFNHCSIPWRCGLGLTKYGYFPCGAGASLCRVFGFDIGARSLKELTLDKIQNQLDNICKYCGHSYVPSKHTVTDKEVTKSWKTAIQSYKDKILTEY